MELTTFSVKQPWAGLLLHGVKRFEVRTWCPTVTGFLLVHASSGKAAGMRELRQDPLFHQALEAGHMEDEASWPQSAILGVVEVVKIWLPGRRRPKLTALDRYLCGNIDGCALWEVGRTWSFAKPIGTHGKLGFWEPQGATRAAVQREVAKLRLPKEKREVVQIPGR